MNITLYGLISCDTCRKARRSLLEAGYEVSYIDVRKDGIGTEKLEKFLYVFESALINKRSTTWRGLSDSERDRPGLELLADYPSLMKRPVIDADGELSLGWGREVQEKFGA